LYVLFFFFLLILRPPTSPLFPYTTLFRSVQLAPGEADVVPGIHREQRADHGGADGAESDRHAAGGPEVAAEVRRDRIGVPADGRSEEHTSELQSLRHLVCRLLLEKKKTKT